MGEPNGVAVIVEDVISAIIVSKVCPNVTGIAILGTNINHTHMEYLQDYTRIIVALDPDATRKSIIYKNEIESWTGVQTYAMFLQDDIKYKTEEDILKLKELTQ
jgi:phosphomannomutase